jgi:hypothetical protein
MENPNLGVFTTHKILKNEDPILVIIHDADGDWQFLAGGTLDMDGAAMAAMKQMIEIDKSVESELDMPIGWVAVRSTKEGEWKRKKV